MTQTITDIDSLINSTETTHDVVVARAANGDPLMGFRIVGMDSKQFRAHEHRMKVDGLRRNASKKKQIDLKTDAGAEEWTTLSEENETKLAAAVVVDWFGFTIAGAPAEFYEGKVLAMLQAKPSWQKAIVSALEEQSNFLPQSAEA